MDDIREIFEKDIAGSTLDADLAVAAEILEKVAAEQGVDLEKLSKDQIAELLVDLMPKKAEHEEKETPAEEKREEKAKKEEKGEEKKEAGVAKAPEPVGLPDTVTFADVAVELGKYASANGIDLSKVSREAYHEAFDKMAAAMTSPEFAKEKQAAAEMEAKLAEADVIGRKMAQAFEDERRKISEKDEKAEKKDEKDEDEKKASVMESLKGGIAKAKELGASGLAHAGKATDKALDFAKKNKGGIAAGTTAAGGAYLLGKSKGKREEREKESVETAALEMARQALRDNGIDPDTGKVASDEDVVRARALEILKEAGWVE